MEIEHSVYASQQIVLSIDRICRLTIQQTHVCLAQQNRIRPFISQLKTRCLAYLDPLTLKKDQVRFGYSALCMKSCDCLDFGDMLDLCLYACMQKYKSCETSTSIKHYYLFLDIFMATLLLKCVNKKKIEIEIIDNH